VGKGGENRSADVKIVQSLLNAHIAKLAPLMPVPVSGVCDAPTVLLIVEFQKRVVKAPGPDGRVDPGGRTLRALDAAPRPSAGEPVLDGNVLPAPAAKVLKEILNAAGVARATVTSVSRTPADQARVMYDNCLSRGVEFNKRMYAAAGDKVVDVFAANQSKPRDTVIALMLKTILEVGPEKVSKHISDTHYTFDVAPNSMPSNKQTAFLAAVRAHKAVSDVIPPPVDPAYHIEIPKNSPHL
jgi:hypothetical protein